MDNRTNKVVIVEGLQYDLYITLQQTRLGEEARLIGKWLTVALVQLALRI